VNEWLGKYLTALDDESRELREELLWKWWSKDHLDLQNIRVEIVDQLHFWISLALTAGMSASDVFDTYLQKNAINHARQEQGYSRANKNEGDNQSIQT
jgi:dimeric dUTPase (all-alpha-NTP-PPase superfamily)